ncbi:MAG: amidase, Asp-tRNAAsn/Glu-tRNAGln amidotransferase subunit [Alphaproteobacteria bacterium]|nr:amidase, Asp-tRNAAsn/Glu-tRNAGln amidotransferase subunit [Alphaproteobacteria bacterium]MDB5741248.1 amidase, Asp-tRNAAsn/Glu-tRNAGln amidotransferase subunit [Alphaproteobacteria bacterium]
MLLAGLATPALAFQVEEASIEGIQTAIQNGQTTCQQVVHAYINRARAYNGVCTALVTADGKPVQSRLGAVRAGSPLKFPTATVAASTLLPNLDKYKGLPLDYGRLESTASDPKVVQQYGMIVGMPHAGQLNALSTLNIRGERSVTCKGAFDAPPGRPLPANAPAACEAFRQQPDALERAAALDKQYGRHPDLKKMPMYCAVMSFKDVYDTSDMRSTGGADTNFATDAPPKDATVVAELRAKGAIIYAKATLAEYNAGPGNPSVPNAAKVTHRDIGGNSARSTWGGAPCNPYDTARETGGSSSGSAVSVGANLAVCSICEETGGSCRQPAWRAGVVAMVTTKGLIPYGGAIGSDPYLDRAGIQCKTVKDAAAVLDAIKDPERGYFDPRDIYTALPKGLVSKAPYSSFVGVNADAKNPAKPLAGLRIGIVREFMVKHTANDAAVSDLVDAQIKKVLRDQLGAVIVESHDPLYPDDPNVPNMTYTFQQALAEILPVHMPEYFSSHVGETSRGGEGRGGDEGDNKPSDKLQFAVPGQDIGSRDYIASLAEGKAPLSDKLNLRSVSASPPIDSFSYHMEQYLMRRGDSRVTDWASLNANTKNYNDAHGVAMLNSAAKIDIASPGITQRMKMREVMRLVIDKVMRENNLDILVNPTITVPPVLHGGASQPTINNRPTGRFPLSADLGIPEITVPAGYNSVMYEPRLELNDKHDNYRSVANNTERTAMQQPMPFGISFWAGPGDEPIVIKVASIYEQATRHRMAPPAFGPVKNAKKE